MFNRALITPDGNDWFVAAEGHEPLGMPRPGLNKKGIGPFEAKLDEINANTQGAQADTSDAELEAAVTAAEATWIQEPRQAKPRTLANSKPAEVIRMPQRSDGATISQICAATGWQAHTVRGTFAGTFKKKLGLTIVSNKPQGGERV